MDLLKAKHCPSLLPCIIIVLVAIATKSLVAIETVISNINTDSIVKQSSNENNLGNVVQQYNVPFLVLLSNDEISVAQLPLIENGNVSIVYRLFDKKQPVEEDENRRKEEDGSSASTASDVVIADAREYEQMPQSTSLGKSEWQQIAGKRKFASDRGKEEEAGPVISPTAASTTAGMTLETVPATSGATKGGTSEDAAEESAKERTRVPRRIRRSGGGGDGSNSSRSDEGTDGSRSNNSSTNAAPESGQQRNVTSARFDGSAGGGRGGSADDEEAQKEGEEEGGAYLASQEEDDKNSNVRFSDFDVHMALGYAFVADSRGRIHRFRLSGSEKPGEYLNFGKGLLLTTEQGEHGDAEYTNTIDGAARSSSNPVKDQLLSYWPTKSGSKSHPDQATNISRENGGFTNIDQGNDDDDDDDANKVDQGSVTHEQSGRHPVDSGASIDVDANANGGGASDGQLSGSGTSGANSATNHAGKQQRGRINANGAAGAPKIIWSRFRQSLSNTAAARHNGALPSNENSDGSSGNVQMASERTQHMESAVEDNEKQLSGAVGRSQDNQQQAAKNDSSQADDDEQTSGANQQQQAVVARRAKLLGTHFLRTEIAVDWLNNLLFVLDKYRLLVVDFDGNNELVLIDDFSVNNRPIDIKVDPVNDFLFWLQVGNFHNTIYKLDLNVLSMQTVAERIGSNAMRLSQVNNRVLPISQQQAGSTSELVALISHHYAHPIITNLPQYAKLFIIDHKHSKIYVPLAPSESGGQERNKTQRDESVEVFAPPSSSPDETNVVTHLNSTLNQIDESPPVHYEGYDKNCTNQDNSGQVQILAYNLDGTDVGSLRGVNDRDHLTNLDNMQDMTLDGDKGYLYCLTNGGQEVFEEYKNANDTVFYSAQHKLDGKKYLKMMHFGTNQPTNRRPRFNLRKLIHMLATSTSSNRWVRSDFRNHLEEAERSYISVGQVQHGPDSDASRFSRNAPYIILGIFCVALLSVYLIYSFLFQSSSQLSSCAGARSREGSIDGSSMNDTNADCDVETSGGGFLGSSTISRYIGKRSTRSADTSTSKRDSSSNGRADNYDIDSTNYDGSNAIDEHYRESMNVHQGLFDLNTNDLANLRVWPSDLWNMSNKLYEPIEVLQDKALASIHRVRIDQLDIERRSPLGEGHFGCVLQGTITCTSDEYSSILNRLQHSTTDGISMCPSGRSSMLNQHERKLAVPSSTSSGHGSSSTSSDFITAKSCTEPNTCDYLTPKSSSTMSDYAVDEAITASKLDSYSSYYNSSNQDDLLINSQKTSMTNHQTKLRVAIKRLKENASAEDKRDFLEEAKLLADFHHPNIVQLIGICLDRGSTYIIMELMLGGDLTRYMQENAPKLDGSVNLTNDDLLDICLDIVNGCCYLESRKYIHRDLAARNCLVSSQKREDRKIKLADFGLARDIYKDSYYKKVNDTAMPLKWMAPECLIEQKFSTLSDVWSFGVVMWEVMNYCREKPYRNVEPYLMKELLPNGHRLPKPEHCSDDIYRLMNKCWQLEPNDRPSFQEVRFMLIEIKSSRRH